MLGFKGLGFRDLGFRDSEVPGLKRLGGTGFKVLGVTGF